MGNKLTINQQLYNAIIKSNVKKTRDLSKYTIIPNEFILCSINVEILKVLLEHNVNPNYQDNDGNTLIHNMIKNNNKSRGVIFYLKVKK